MPALMAISVCHFIGFVILEETQCTFVYSIGSVVIRAAYAYTTDATDVSHTENLAICPKGPAILYFTRIIGVIYHDVPDYALPASYFKFVWSWVTALLQVASAWKNVSQPIPDYHISNHHDPSTPSSSADTLP